MLWLRFLVNAKVINKQKYHIIAYNLRSKAHLKEICINISNQNENK